jgi:hypothetical protein
MQLLPICRPSWQWTKEWTVSYHSAPVNDLIAFVQTAIEVCHGYTPPVKVTNAGLTARGLVYLVYDYYRLTLNDTAKAAAWKAIAFFGT